MSFTLIITETQVAKLKFDTAKQATKWMNKPNYNDIEEWVCTHTEYDLVEDAE